MKPFWRKVWGSMNGVGLGALGATTFYGEYGQYNDQFAAGTNLCSFEQAGGNLGDFCAATNTNALLESAFNLDPGTIKANGLTITNVPGGLFEGAFVTGSEVQRWGLGVVQEIDAAAMHVFARWQHQEIDLDLTGISLNDPVGCLGGAGLASLARETAPSAGARSVRASTTGICSRLAASSSSKPTTQTHIHRKPPPFGAASFFATSHFGRWLLSRRSLLF